MLAPPSASSRTWRRRRAPKSAARSVACPASVLGHGPAPPCPQAQPRRLPARALPGVAPHAGPSVEEAGARLRRNSTPAQPDAVTCTPSTDGPARRQRACCGAASTRGAAASSASSASRASIAAGARRSRQGPTRARQTLPRTHAAHRRVTPPPTPPQPTQATLVARLDYSQPTARVPPTPSSTNTQWPMVSLADTRPRRHAKCPEQPMRPADRQLALHRSQCHHTSLRRA